MFIKVNLLVKNCLRNEKKEYNIKGIYNDSKIKIQEDHTLMIIDLKNKIITRKKNNYEIILNFDNKKAIIIDNKIKIDIDLEVLKLNVNNNYFLVNYKINDDLFKYEIKII